MERFQAGDLITFRLHGDDFGLAQVLIVEDLALQGHYHLALLDAILKGEDGGVDSYGVFYNRSHTLDGAELSPVVIDHIALTMEALAESDPMKVGERPVKEADLIGYHAWMLNMRESLVRRGLIHEAAAQDAGRKLDDEAVEDIDEIAGEMDEAVLEVKIAEDEVFEDEEEPAGEAGESGADDTEEDGDEEPITIELRPWHQVVYGEPLDTVMFRLHDEFEWPELKQTTLGAYICSFFDESNMEAINEMVNRFVEGDYGAGHELLAFGDPAVDALAAHLQDSIDPQLADDILNVLCDSGTMRAYEHITTFFLQHEGNGDDPLAIPAARGFCYAVMITGGTPQPLREQLAKLDDIPFPELEHDVSAAKEAVAGAPQNEP